MKMQTFTLKGRVASIGDGIVKGIARIVNSESELDKIQPGDIMVAPQTDINFVPSLELCVGLVTEQGGRFCHAAIFSRENNLPCITDVENARTIIPDGMEIIVDTNSNSISWT
jgi:phosphoenolpyruvate synthase/pyruvate phosphate dikinase